MIFTKCKYRLVNHTNGLACMTRHATWIKGPTKISISKCKSHVKYIYFFQINPFLYFFKQCMNKKGPCSSYQSSDIITQTCGLLVVHYKYFYNCKIIQWGRVECLERLVESGNFFKVYFDVNYSLNIIYHQRLTTKSTAGLICPVNVCKEPAVYKKYYARIISINYILKHITNDFHVCSYRFDWIQIIHEDHELRGTTNSWLI